MGVGGLPRAGLLLGVAAAVAFECNSDLDCELNGVCDLNTKVCACDPQWKGDSCGKMRLGKPSYAYGGPDSDVTSWGAGPPVKMGDRWYLFVTEMADHCGLSEWQHHSTVIRAVSDRPAGPYVRESVVIDKQAHNPYYVFDPVSQTHLIFHIGGSGNTPLAVTCDDGRTTTKLSDEPPEEEKPKHAAARAHHGKGHGKHRLQANFSSELFLDAAVGFEPEARRVSNGASAKLRRLRGEPTGIAALQPTEPLIQEEEFSDSQDPDSDPDTRWTAGPRVAQALSLDGDFTQVEMNKAPGPALHFGGDNPAPYIFDNGTVILLTRRYLGQDNSKIYLTRAESYKGPYEVIPGRSKGGPAGDFSPSEGNHEDPCIWRDARGHFHAFFHFGQTHAFSPDGIEWHWGSDNAWDGGHLDGVPLHDAERPRVMMGGEGANRRPTLLFFASGGRSQPTKIGADSAKGFTVVRHILSQ